MPTTQTVRPNATVSNPGGWTISAPGSPTAHGVTSDDDDSTSLQMSAPNGPYGITLELGTYALAADERCQRIRTRARGLALDHVSYWTAELSSNGALAGEVSFTSDGTAVTRAGPWVTVDPDTGLEWTQARIDALRSYVEAWNGPSGSPYDQVNELYVDLDIHKKPAVAISTPNSGQVVTTTTPTIGWTYTGDGDVQKKYRLKVFDKAVAEDAGFDVDVSATVYDSGWVTGSAASAIAASGLDYGGDYYAYVRVAKDFNGEDWNSDWSSGRDFSVNTRPVVVVTAPSGAIADTNKPSIVWTYTDEEGDAQSHYEARVYEEPGAGWAGFDPDTTLEVPVWTSGEVASSSTTVQVGVGLPNTTNYRAYVRAKHTTPAVIWSLWDYEDFNTNFTPAPTPTISVSDAGAHYITLDFAEGAGGPPTADWVTVERTLDGGVTWETFRYGSLSDTSALDPADLPASITDYEVPLLQEVSYRTFSVTTDSGSEVASAPSASVSGTTTGKKIWLKDPSDGSLGVSFPVEDVWLPMSRTRDRTVIKGIGRTKPIVVRGIHKGISFTMNYVVLGQDTYDALMELLLADRTLFLQSPKGNFYMEVSGDITETPHLWDDLRGEEDVWKVSVPYVEVDF